MIRFWKRFQYWLKYGGPRSPGLGGNGIHIDGRRIKRRDVFRYEDMDRQGGIFKSTGDQAIPYCKAREEGVIRTSYTDGSCLYPEDGDTVVTFEDGTREIMR